MTLRAWNGVIAAVLLLGACADDGAVQGASADQTDDDRSLAGDAVAETTVPSEDQAPAAPPPTEQLERVRLTANQIADVGMLTAIAWRDGDPDPYLADQHGNVHHLVDGRAEVVLDLTAQVLDYEQGAEYGMLGMTFDPVDGRLVVGFNGNDVDTRIVSYAVGGDGRPDPASEREILRVDQPGVGHNSGTLAFDADANLLIAMGDGGGSRGADAQDMTKLLGGLLRITPDRDGPGYTVPDDNPHVGQAGVAPEIWAKGMRNPWRFSIDHATGDLWLGDVGESAWEAVYRIPADAAGANLGWPAFEGSHPVDFNPEVAAPPEPLMPVHEYPHSVGPAVIGGHVYRGSAIPELAGAYVFMDMTGPVWALGSDGVVQLDVEAGGVQTSLGEGPDGELYLLTMNNGLFKLEPA
ncbi:MAG TPA: PQQ-dependent sugar dehydrogenase [Acidimicrobiales bacterium]|nr:PQQ-dependent sugar dehydrogenase [Acidimicrobiales bacterium]